VKSIVDHHNGSIRVTSSADAPCGTTFTLELPLGR
jgi:signal transduction histidine kinase